MASTFQKTGNAILKPLLRSPLHFLFSKTMMLITFTGRKSGKVYTTPVQYMREGDMVIFLTLRKRVWWRNLRGQAEVSLRLRGRELPGTVTAIIDDADAVLETAKRMYPQLGDARIRAMMPDYIIVKIQI